MRRYLALSLIVFLGLFPAERGLAAAVVADNSDKPGWSTPFIGTGKGQWATSVGLFLHSDGNLAVRNFQLRADLDVAPGLRLHMVGRSNRELDTLSRWQPRFDEGYLEGFAFHRSKTGDFSTSLRIGNIRYLHFPYPDSIAIFDTVPSTSDIREGSKQAAAYSGSLLTLDYAFRSSGLGLHASGIKWGFERHGGSQLLENYVFFHHNAGILHFEARYGGLQTREQPLGDRAIGYNLYIGSVSRGMTYGLLYEKLHHQTAYTGVMVTFPLDPVTKVLGSVAFDWDRNPSGFAVQLPLAGGMIGGIRSKAPANGVLVGEVRVERIRTYCSNGQVRNFYEHRLAAWGETGAPDLVVVLKEEPWYLQAEAVVSPHTFAVGFSKWDKDRTGPAQLSQSATYKFYRLKK